MGQIKAEGRERGRGGAEEDWAPDPQSRGCRKLSRAVREPGPPTADRDAGWSRPRPQHPHFPTPRSPQRARGAAGSGRRQGAGRGPRGARLRARFAGCKVWCTGRSSLPSPKVFPQCPLTRPSQPLSPRLLLFSSLLPQTLGVPGRVDSAGAA